MGELKDINQQIEESLIADLIHRILIPLRGVSLTPARAAKLLEALSENIKKRTEDTTEKQGQEYLVTVNGLASYKLRARSPQQAEYQARQVPMLSGKWEVTWFWDEPLEVEEVPR